MAGDDRRNWGGDSDRSALDHSADSSTWSRRRGPDADWLQRLRALLRLRASRRAAGVRLLWQRHRQSVGSENSSEKSRAVDSGANCVLWIGKTIATKRHKKHKRGDVTELDWLNDRIRNVARGCKFFFVPFVPLCG